MPIDDWSELRNSLSAKFEFKFLFADPGAGDQFKNMAGVRESVTFTEICPGKVAAHWIVHSSPKPWTFFATFTEGIEQTIDFGHFGGKNKVFFNATADGYQTCMESEKYGKTTLVEKFSDSGLDRVRIKTDSAASIGRFPIEMKHKLDC